MDDKRREEIINQLTELLSRIEAKVLLFLKENGASYAMDIEHDTGMRQPETSMATRRLLEKKLITVTQKTHGKGRPRNIYDIDKSAKTKLLKIVDTRTTEVKQIKEAIEEVF